MALRGEVDQIPLSHILQGLILNGQEGLIRIEGGSLKRRVRVLSLGLRPLNFSKELPDLLKEIVLKQRILRETQFQNILSTWVPGSMPAGDFLVSRGIIAPELVQKELCHQLENSLHEIFSTPGLKYEFSTEEDPTPYEIFAPDGLGGNLVYNVNSLLMEAMRQADEWRRLLTEIPSRNEIFVLANPVAVKTKNLQIPREQWKQIRPLLNGENTVQQLIQLTPLSAFEVYQVLFQLKSQGLLKPLPVESKRALADKLRRMLRSDEAGLILRSIVEADPQDEPTRLKLIAVLEKSKNSAEELLSHYEFLAEAKRSVDPDRARAYLEKILAQKPNSVGALSALFDLHHERNDSKDALAVARAVVAAARLGAGQGAAMDLLYRIINFYPDEPFLFHELSDIYAEQSNVDGAVDCLRTAAEIYAKRRDHARFRKTCERIAQLKPQESERLKRLTKLDCKSGRPVRALLVFTLVTSLSLGLAASLLWAIANEYFSRVLFAQVRSDVATQNRFGQATRARHTLEDYSRAFPFSISIHSVPDLLTEVDNLARKRDEELKAAMEKRRTTAASDYARSKVAADSNEYEKAIQILGTVDFSALEPKIAAEAYALHRHLTNYFKESASLAQRADLAERSQRIGEAYQLRLELLTKYPHSAASRDVHLPVELKSVPAGAEVQLDGTRIGSTPVVLKVSPGKTPRITIAKRGFKSVTLQTGQVPGADFNPLTSQVVVVPLPKAEDWKFNAEGPIEGFPVVVGDSVCFGTRNGAVFCLRNEDGGLLWKFTVPGSMDLAGGIRLWKEVVYFGCFDGKVYALSPQTGKLALPPVPATGELLPIKVAPSIPSDSGVIVVNVDSRSLVGIQIATGQLVWSFAPGAGQLIGEPQAANGSIYIPTTSGELLELRQETGELQRRLALDTSLTLPGKLAEQTYYFGTGTGTLLALEVKTGQTLWSYAAKGALTAPPTVSAEGVLFPISGGTLLCMTPKGQPRWQSQIGDSMTVEAPATLSGTTFLVGTGKGSIVCVDFATGKTAWQFDTPGAQEQKRPRGILSQGAVDKGKFFIGSEDHFFYCLSLD